MPYSVHYDPSCSTLYSATNGVLDFGDVAAWEAELYGAVRTLSEGTKFQFIDDLRGYEVGDQTLAVHKEYREVTPRFLAAHGFVVGFFRLYELEPPAPSEPRHCLRVVHLHHDEHKMTRYRELLGTPNESFFADVDTAREWLSRG
jgi:hypothetical protein